jgi:hypothetical protein
MMVRAKGLVMSNRSRMVPIAIVVALVAGVIMSIVATHSAQADYYTGCNYGYGSGATGFGSGSGIAYGYGYVSGGSFAYGNGNQVCPLSVTTSSLPGATVGSSYSQTLSGTGGKASYTWSLSSGSLPAGLTLSSGGTISGTPTTSGSQSFTVAMTDANSQSVTQALSISVAATTTTTSPPATTTTSTTTTTIAVTTAPPPSGIVSTALGTPVSVAVSSTAVATDTLSSAGSTASVTIPAGALPAGTAVSLYPVTDTSSLVSQVPANSTYVVAFAISWKAPDGTSPAATSPITLTVSNPAIKAGDTIYIVTSHGLTAVGTAVADGTATITFTSDPVFLIASPAAATTTTTSPTTTTTTPAPRPKQPRVIRVAGVARVGTSRHMALIGSGFYGQPTITSTAPGTRVGVLHDNGRVLNLVVTVSGKTAKPGRAHVYTFTVRDANGQSSKVNYRQY